jgi:hypothetical protein
MFAHSVYTTPTKATCLAAGGHFYTAAHLGRSLEGVKLQEDHPELCNEDLNDQVYSTLTKIIKGCDDLTTPEEKASIISSSSLFREPLPVPEKPSVQNMRDMCRFNGIPFDRDDSKATLERRLRSGESPERRKFRAELASFGARFGKSQNIPIAVK